MVIVGARLPYDFLRERYFTPRQQRSPFVQRASAFQDFVIRCVRYAFAHMPAYIGRVFFSKAVALPFLYFRMLRHGYFSSPISWREVNRVRRNRIQLSIPTDEFIEGLQRRMDHSRSASKA